MPVCFTAAHRYTLIVSSQRQSLTLTRAQTMRSINSEILILRSYGVALYALLQAASFMHSLLITIKPENCIHPLLSTMLQQKEYDQTIKILRAVSVMMVEGLVQLRGLNLKFIFTLYYYTGPPASAKIHGRPPSGLAGLMR